MRIVLARVLFVLCIVTCNYDRLYLLTSVAAVRSVNITDCPLWHNQRHEVDYQTVTPPHFVAY